MYENKNHKSRGICLKSPEDVRRIATRIISDVFRDKAQIEQAGKVNNLQAIPLFLAISWPQSSEMPEFRPPWEWVGDLVRQAHKFGLKINMKLKSVA